MERDFSGDLNMLPFVLYFAGAVVTGFHLYTLLALAVYGAPFNPLELLAMLGSLALFIAAYISLYRPNAAARVALIAALAIWAFYAPAIAKTVRARFGSSTVVRTIGIYLLPTPHPHRIQID